MGFRRVSRRDRVGDVAGWRARFRFPAVFPEIGGPWGLGIPSCRARPSLFLLSYRCHTLYCVLIFDSSTLILLAKAELLDIFLNDFEGRPLLPGAVEAESTGTPDRPDGLLIQQRILEGRLIVQGIKQPKVLSRLVQDFRLGLGEAEAIVLALDLGDAAVVATDDLNAMRACKVLRIGFVTSLGVLVRAVEKGLITPADGERFLERLSHYGRFRNEVIAEISRQIGGIFHGESSEDR